MKIHLYAVLVIISLLTSCGMMHNTMHAGNATPDTQATPVVITGNIALIDPWARASTAGDNSASYVVIKNSGPADTLIAVRGDVATNIELHTVESVDGMMRMKQVDGGIVIPSNDMQILKPGSYHIMMIGLTRDLVAGDRIALTLTFANAGDVAVTVPVR